jgi:hypothetical protein
MSNRRMVSIAGGSQPQWRADQAELFYLASDETVMAVAASQGGTPAFGVPQPLFRANVAGNAGDARDQFAVDPAGERFLIAGESSENDSQAITVVVNWAAGMVEAADGAAQLAPLVRQQF